MADGARFPGRGPRPIVAAVSAAAGSTCAAPAANRPPKPVLRWLTVLLAAAGWYVSLQLLRVSLGADTANPFLQLACGSADTVDDNSCLSVLTSPQAFIPLSRQPGALKIPSAFFGLAYFAFVGLWYVFIGPPAARGRRWHALILVVVVVGVGHSLRYMGVMAWELHRWCAGCLVAHGLNGGLLLLTLLAYPWHERRRHRAADLEAATRADAPPTPALPHPTARLVLATVAAGVLAGIAQFGLLLAFQLGGLLRERSQRYEQLVNDPAYVVWDFHRQMPVDVPLREDEAFAGAPGAPHTLVVFGDFQCTACRAAHDLVPRLLERHAGRLRVAFRHYPQDPACNPNPAYRRGGHAAACPAALAAEAAREIGGELAYAKMRALLYERQLELPTGTSPADRQKLRRLLENWAANVGLDPSTFGQALDDPRVAERVRSNIELGERLGLRALPALFLDGRRVVGWSKLETWDALLAPAAATAPASTPESAARPEGH